MTETALRLSIFLGVLAVLAIAEAWAPWRAAQRRAARWPSNLAVVVLNSVLLRILLPFTAAGLAVVAEERGWGLFNAAGTPLTIAAPLSVIALDLAVYGQHVVFHHVPALWRLHRMHHADTSLDVTTGLRFHPVEIIISMAWKFVVVVALGVPAAAVIAFEVILNASSMFSHANIVLPAPVDRAIRLLLVTPDMHRVHHSVERHEHDSNYGFNLSCWDRLFGTYRDMPAQKRDELTIGLTGFRGAEEARIDRMLTQPFRQD